MDGFDGRRRAGVDALLTFAGRGSIQAALFDLGPYPAAVPGPSGLVRGELYEMTDPAAALAALDRFEDCDPARPDESLYIRTEMAVSCDDGGSRLAWVYLFRPALGSAARIASGDYRQHVESHG